MIFAKFHLKYNRSGLGCLLFFMGTPLVLILFWRLAPSSLILRLELQNQMGRMAYDTSRTAGPTAVPVLQEFLTHEDPGTRVITINATGAYIGSHQDTSQPLVSALCQRALHDKSKAVQHNAIIALRSVNRSSPAVDQTAVELMDYPNEDICQAAKDLLLIRIARGIEISPEVCTVREQLKPALKRVDPENCTAKYLRAFLEKCEHEEKK